MIFLLLLTLMCTFNVTQQHLYLIPICEVLLVQLASKAKYCRVNDWRAIELTNFYLTFTCKAPLLNGTAEYFQKCFLIYSKKNFYIGAEATTVYLNDQG